MYKCISNIYKRLDIFETLGCSWLEFHPPGDLWGPGLRDVDPH